MSEIRTNEIIPHFDYQKIDTEYDIFCLETSRKYISTGAGIIDAPLMTRMSGLSFLKPEGAFMSCLTIVRTISAT